MRVYRWNWMLQTNVLNYLQLLLICKLIIFSEFKTGLPMVNNRLLTFRIVMQQMWYLNAVLSFNFETYGILRCKTYFHEIYI